MSERVSSGPTRPTTKCGAKSRMSASHHAMRSPLGRGHGLVERLALALAGSELGQHVVDRDDAGAGVGGHAGGGVGGVVVHHEDLVDQPARRRPGIVRICSTIGPTVAASSRAGRHTLTTWPWRALSSARAAASKSPCR